MNANLFEQTRATELNQALRDYNDAKQNYQRMLRQALSENDSSKRTEALQAVEAENKRLVTVVEVLVRAITEGELQHKNQSEQVEDLNKHIQQYKEDLEYMRGKSDKVIQLRELLATLTNESSNDRKQYYGYIVGILVLLIIVFVFFVYSYAASVINSVTETVASVTAPVTEAAAGLTE